ncbi:uncharacterized protein LOC136028626 [Artemia franciscana]|uniref:Uncharacterized protein n=1 Tax=Artemia franciscana TaxID=6661 RepID=A0AA88KTX3_ARTSF|nr:hypothetical protein QYM36_014691 [Artemia franciscana]
MWAILLSFSIIFVPSLTRDIEGTLADSFNHHERFFLDKKTVTNLIITTSTTARGVQTWCYAVVSGLIPVFSTGTFSSDAYLGTNTIFVNSASACRKRRWSFENPFDGSIKGILFPSAIAATDDRVAALALTKANENVATEDEMPHELIGKQPRLGLNFIQTVTQRLTAISTIITTTQVKTMILTCTPLDLGLSSCTRSVTQKLKKPACAKALALEEFPLFGEEDPCRLRRRLQPDSLAKPKQEPLLHNRYPLFGALTSKILSKFYKFYHSFF